MATDERQLRSLDLTGWPLAIKVTMEQDSVRVAMEGEIDLATADEAAAAIQAAARIGTRVVVDLSEVSFIDSTGLLVLLRLSSHDKHDGGQLSFIASKHASVKRMLAVTGISEFLS